MQQFPVFLNLNQFACAVVGGGDVAYRKVTALLKAQAEVTMIAPELCSELAKLAQENDKLHWLQDYYRDELIKDMRLVIAATDDDEVNAQIHHYCEANKILVNAVDQPALCRYTTPSIVDRSPILIAISSNGVAPVLARRIRAKLETELPKNIADLAQYSGQIRDRIKQTFTSFAKRRHFWERFFTSRVANNIDQLSADQRESMTNQLIEQEQQAQQNQIGEVWLVGAGPGDPELLTIKALQKMQLADVILHDRLVSKEILDLARKDAEFVSVGKQKGFHSKPQPEINQLLVDYALQGKKVCRLKGGDPFIFGRGGEELEKLINHQIPFQVVPAVTAAAGCSAYAGIPLTHRDHAQSVTFVTGHCKGSGQHADWQSIARPNQTIVIYMGLSQAAEIRAQLISNGINQATPIALVERGTTDKQRTVTGVLSELPELIEQHNVQSPAVIIVGDVVKLHDKLDWFKGNQAAEQAFVEYEV